MYAKHPRVRGRGNKLSGDLTLYAMSGRDNRARSMGVVFQKGSRHIAIGRHKRTPTGMSAWAWNATPMSEKIASVLLNTGNMKTRQTLNAMQSVARRMGFFALKQSKHRWYVLIPSTGEEVRYYDGLTLFNDSDPLRMYDEKVSSIEDKWLEHVDNYMSLVSPVWKDEAFHTDFQESLKRTYLSDIPSTESRSVAKAVENSETRPLIMTQVLRSAYKKWYSDWVNNVPEDPNYAMKLVASFCRLRLGLVVQ